MSFDQTITFDRNTFFYQLLKHRVGMEENPERYMKDGEVIVAPALELLDGTVFRAIFDCKVEADKLKPYPRYLELCGKWKRWEYKKGANGKNQLCVKIYSIEPVYHESIRTNYYDVWKNNKDVKFQLEFVISLCTACGMEDRQYIYDAIDAFCDESLDGKGLRKILLQGVIIGCWKFEEIAFNGIKPGLMESCYEKFLSNSANQGIIDFLYHEITGEKGESVSKEMRIGTRTFVNMASQCGNADDFIRLLDNPLIQCGALFDILDTTYIVKEFIAQYEKNLGCSASSYACRFVPRATYNGFVHGRCRQPFFFLKLACIFGFTQKEFDTMLHSLHLNGENLYGFDLCEKGIREMCTIPRHSVEYRQACAALMEKLRKGFDCGSDGIPTNTNLKSFYTVLDKVSHSDD